jgi:hypothetical protein
MGDRPPFSAMDLSIREPGEEMRSPIAGALAGFLATLPMTAVMHAGHRRLPETERYPMPPRLIIERVTAELGGEDAQRQLTALLHYAYGAASGAVYGCLSDGTGGRTGLATGTTYGLLVWAASYLGWIPAVDILHPATRHPRDRVAIMLAAHVVWGGGTGLLTRLLEEPRRTGRHDRRGARRPAPAPASSALAALAGGAALVLALDRLGWHREPFSRPTPPAAERRERHEKPRQDVA